jgi:hypothetical protein
VLLLEAAFPRTMTDLPTPRGDYTYIEVCSL